MKRNYSNDIEIFKHTNAPGVMCFGGGGGHPKKLPLCGEGGGSYEKNWQAEGRGLYNFQMTLPQIPLAPPRGHR